MGSAPAHDNKQGDGQQSDTKQTRRRGAELETAILDAATCCAPPSATVVQL